MAQYLELKCFNALNLTGSDGAELHLAETSQGSRKRRNSSHWDKIKRKEARNSAQAKKQPFIACSHTADYSAYQANTLMEDDVKGDMILSLHFGSWLY